MKKSLILHNDSLEILEELSDEEAGKLLKAIYKANLAIANEKTQSVNMGYLGLSRLEWVLFKPFYNQLLRDYEKYKTVCERNKNNGKKGGRKPNKTQSPPVKADSDSDSDSDKDSDNKKGKDIDNILIANPLLDESSFTEWMSYKKYKTKAPITKCINFLSKYDKETQKQIVDTSIMNGWKGLFEPKQQNIQIQLNKNQQRRNLIDEALAEVNGTKGDYDYEC